MPIGSSIVLDPQTRRLDAMTWIGGSPERVLKLTATGVRVWPELAAGVVRSRNAGVMARSFTDAGLAHPRPASAGNQALADCTVVVPVRDRSSALERCLRSLGPNFSLIVVDDASANPEAIAEVCRRHGATLVRRDMNGGPGAARETGLQQVTTEFVAFVDSDTLPEQSDLETLCGHFVDPAVGAVAPRIRPLRRSGALNRYLQSRSSLDLGPAEALVAPGTRVPYVPTAVLVARCAALRAVARGTSVFDAGLRYGEDVDLVWRLGAGDWRVRYDPSVVVRHDEPRTCLAMLGRKYRYGTSAGPLANRHGRALAPVVVQPFHALTLTAMLTRKPLLATAGFALATVHTHQAYDSAGLPHEPAAPERTLRAIWQVANHTARFASQFGTPALLLGAAAGLSPRATGARRRRAFLCASTLLLPALNSWMARSAPLDPLRYSAAYVAEECAYGAGVIKGSWSARTTGALLPRIARPRNPFRKRRPVAAMSTDTRGKR